MLRQWPSVRAAAGEELVVYCSLFRDVVCAAAFSGAVAAIAFAGVEDKHAVSLLLTLCTILVV